MREFSAKRSNRPALHKTSVTTWLSRLMAGESDETQEELGLRRGTPLPALPQSLRISVPHREAARKFKGGGKDDGIFVPAVTADGENRHGSRLLQRVVADRRMDGKLAGGICGRLSRPWVSWLSKKTILGDPMRSPWNDLHRFDAKVEIEEFSFGMYYIYKAKKNTCSHVSREQN